jgi:hypothetical protein
VEIKALAEGMDVEIVGAKEWVLEPQTKLEGRFFLVRNQADVQVPQEKVMLQLTNQGDEFDEIKTNFMAPVRAEN